MNPIEQLLKALSMVGQGTSASSQALNRELTADAQLNQQGSLMGSAKTGPRAATQAQGPAMATISQLLNALGPSPIDAGNAAHIPGTYRALGLQRTGGDLNPAQYLMQLQQQANYPRFLELVQNMVRKNLGESFDVSRAAKQTDPLIQAIQQGAQAPATAVTTNPGVAERFLQTYAEASRKPSYLAQGRATPQDIGGLVPRRNTHGHEAELVLNPTPSFQPQLTAKGVPSSGGFPFERKPLEAAPDDYIQAIQAALQQAAQVP